MGKLRAWAGDCPVHGLLVLTSRVAPKPGEKFYCFPCHREGRHTVTRNLRGPLEMPK